jgi:hypothetical protein
LWCGDGVVPEAGWVVVSGAGVAGFLHAVEVGVAVAFDDSGVGAFAAGWVEVPGPGDLGSDVVCGGVQVFRGEMPLCQWQSGGPGAGCVCS